MTPHANNENSECYGPLRRMRWNQTRAHLFHDRLKSERVSNGIMGIETLLDTGDWQGRLN